MLRKYIRYLMIVVEASSIPLLILILLMILSGYGILYPDKIRMLTGGLISDRIAFKIHTDIVIRISIIAILLIHGFTGLLLLSEKYIRNNLMKKIIILCITVVLVFLLMIPILLDLVR